MSKIMTIFVSSSFLNGKVNFYQVGELRKKTINFFIKDDYFSDRPLTPETKIKLIALTKFLREEKVYKIESFGKEVISENLNIVIGWNHNLDWAFIYDGYEIKDFKKAKDLFSKIGRNPKFILLDGPVDKLSDKFLFANNIYEHFGIPVIINEFVKIDRARCCIEEIFGRSE